MSQEIKAFIGAAREKGLNDDDIKEKLLAAGWDKTLVESALSGLEVPLPPQREELSVPQPGGTISGSHPVTIVQNQSTRGFEYNIMFIALLITAFGFAGLLHDAVDLMTNTSVYGHIGGVFAITSLLVLGPIFTLLFFRLKKAEEEEPELRKDPFRKRWIQTTLFFTFLIGIGHIIYFVYSILTPTTRSAYDYYSLGSRDPGVSTLALALHVLVTLLVAGGIFAYYWIDDHKTL